VTKKLQDWNILFKVIAIVTDGGANIKLVVTLMEIQLIPCTAHKLNLIIQQALKLLGVCLNELPNELMIMVW